jgi:hypothetical protein
MEAKISSSENVTPFFLYTSDSFAKLTAQRLGGISLTSPKRSPTVKSTFSLFPLHVESYTDEISDLWVIAYDKARIDPPPIAEPPMRVVEPSELTFMMLVEVPMQATS